MIRLLISTSLRFPKPSILALGGLLTQLKSTTKILQCQSDFKPLRTPILQPPPPPKPPTLFQLLKPDLPLLLGVAFTAVVAAMVNITIPTTIGNMMSVNDSAYLLSLFLAQGVLTLISISLVAVLGERISLRLNGMVYKSIMYQSISFFDKNHSSELNLTSDINTFKHTYKAIISSINNLTMVLGSVYKLFKISSVLSGYLTGFAVVAYGIGNIYASYLRYLSKVGKEKEAKSQSIISESVGNIRTVKAFTNEEYELERYLDARKEVSGAQVRLGFHIGVFQGLINLSIGMMILSVLYLGRDMEKADLMGYLMTVQNAQRSLVQLSVLFAQTIKASSAIGRVFENIQMQHAEYGMKTEIGGNIEFHDVGFSYSTREKVLQGFNLNIQKGTVVALCGGSGGGKSTIASLIERFYDIQEGCLTIDSVNIKDIDLKWLRQNIGYISQEPVLFAGSIGDNIRYGRMGASDEEVREAAKLANAADFIESFPEGYNTLVGERGVALSGGQKQRIAIARALLKDPKILILDEATSALDAESERSVQSALDRLMDGKTVLIIAHRLSTIEKADKIVVIDKGRIAETGTHSELLGRRGVYYNMYMSKE